MSSVSDQSPTATGSASGASYAAAGVDIEAGDRAVELMKEWVKKTQRPEVLGGLGGFAGLFDASALKRFERPLLASIGRKRLTPAKRHLRGGGSDRYLLSAHQVGDAAR